MVFEQFATMAMSHPEKIAICGDTEELRYESLLESVNATAKLLDDLGLGSRHTLAIEGINTNGYVIGFLAAAKQGICVIPIDERLSREEISQLLRDGQPSAHLIFNPDGNLAKLLAEDAGDDRVEVTTPRHVDGTLYVASRPSPHPHIEPGDLVVQYSSGSTGQPKGVVLSRENIYHKVMNWNATLGITDDDVLLNTLTLCHCYGMYVHTLAALFAGARVVMLDLSTVMPGVIARNLVEHKVTVFGTLPYMYNMMLSLPEHKVDLTNVRYLISGSAPLADATAHAFQSKFKRNINQVYGLTEIGLITFNKEALDPTSIGQSTHNMQAKVLRGDGTECDTGEAGELVVRCASLSRGYLNSPIDEKEMFKDGWLYTKDIVTRSESGDFHIKGRMSQFINVSGNKVSPTEVENALISHPSVCEAAVLGRRDPVSIEAVVAFVVPEPGTSPEERELIQHCIANLSAHKVPKQITLMTELPKSPLGKVLKSELL